MGYMFTKSNITNCGMAGWDTSNVTNMAGTFSNSVVLEDLSGWDVSKVQCMREIFSDYGARYSQVSSWGFQKMNPNINKWNPVSVSNFKAAFQNVWLWVTEDEASNIGPFHLHEWRMPAIPANEASSYAGDYDVSGPISDWNNTSNLARQRISRPSFALPPISPSYKPDYTIYTSHGRNGVDHSRFDPSNVVFKQGTWKTIRTSYGLNQDGATYPSDYSLDYKSERWAATIDIFANDDGGSFQFSARSRYNLFRLTFAGPFGEYPELVNAPTNMSRLLEAPSNAYNISNIYGFENINTSNVTNMSNLFYNMSNAYKFKIGHVDISGWDVSNVTNMNRMFGNGSRNSISAGDLSSWCVPNVRTKPLGWPGPLDRVVEKDPYWGQCPSDPDFEPVEPGGMPDGDWNTKTLSVLIESNDYQYADFPNSNHYIWERQKGQESFRYLGRKSSELLDPSKEYIIAHDSPSFGNWQVPLGINFLAADTSNVTSMAFAFVGFPSNFNGTGLEFFNTSNVNNIYKIFNGKSRYNQDLSGWDLRKVYCSYRWDYNTSSWASRFKPTPGYGPQ